MSDGGADRCGIIGGVLGTSAVFVIWIYYVSYMCVFIARLGT